MNETMCKLKTKYGLKSKHLDELFKLTRSNDDYEILLDNFKTINIINPYFLEHSNNKIALYMFLRKYDIYSIIFLDVDLKTKSIIIRDKSTDKNVRFDAIKTKDLNNRSFFIESLTKYLDNKTASMV